MLNTYIFYHGQCWDGVAATWVLSKYLQPNNPIYVPCIHGTIPKEVNEVDPTDSVFIVDFAFDLETTEKLYKTANYFYLFDHHITAKEQLGHLDYCDFDMDHSGAMLTFIKINKNLNPPLALKYFEALDLYKKDQYDIVSFGSYLRQFPVPTMEIVDDIINNFDEQEVLRIGKANHELLNTVVNSFADSGFYSKINNTDVYCSFAPKNLMHEIAMESSRRNDRTNLGVAIKVGRDHIGLSFRLDQFTWPQAQNDTLCVCQHLGGGGHRYASGAQMSDEQFIELFKNREK